jgi:hypothetical protein
MSTNSTALAKIPTKLLPQILDDIIEQKEYEKANQDNSYSITEEEKDISICKRIKHNCKGKDVISFNHMEQELQFRPIETLQYNTKILLEEPVFGNLQAWCV